MPVISSLNVLGGASDLRTTPSPASDAIRSLLTTRSRPRRADLNHALVRGRNDKKAGSEGSVMINDINDEVILTARLRLAALFVIFGWRNMGDYSGTALLANGEIRSPNWSRI